MAVNDPLSEVRSPLLVEDGSGLRYDDGKCRLDLIPAEWFWALGDVMTQGAKKYNERNWEKGMLWSKCVGCMFRHILKWLCGEGYDKTTGCHHLAMVAWNALALMSYDIRGHGENDLHRNSNKPELVNIAGLQDLKGEPE